MRSLNPLLRAVGRSLLLSILRIGGLFALVGIGLWLWLAQPLPGSQPRSELQIAPQHLRSHVETLSITFHPRNFQNPANLEKTAAYIRAHFQRAGGRVSDQLVETQRGRYRNITAVFGAGKGRKYVIGAHYDSHDETPGADDNASGVAGLLELATLLGRHGSDREIELVAWTLEEPPFFAGEEMGSFIHAAALKKSGQAIEGAISLEMIGYFSDTWGSQEYPLPGMQFIYSPRGNFIAVVGRRADSELIKHLKQGMQGRTELPVYSMSAPEDMPGIGLSDQLNYWKHGFTAVMITDTAFERNQEYHANDTADRLDYRRMGQVVVALYEAVRK